MSECRGARITMRNASEIEALLDSLGTLVDETEEKRESGKTFGMRLRV